MYKDAQHHEFRIYVSPITSVSSQPSLLVYAAYPLLHLEHTSLCTVSVGLVIAFVQAPNSG